MGRPQFNLCSCGCVGLAATIVLAVVCPVQSAESRWLTGAALDRRLAEPTDVLWSAESVRQGLQNLSRGHNIAVLLDRRLDPSQTLNLKEKSRPLIEIVREIAERQNASVANLSPVLYIGPAEVAKNLRTLAAIRSDEGRKQSSDVQRRLLHAKPLLWPDLTEPRALILELAAEAKLELHGADAVPHDLWAAADLPALPWTDRLTLVAAQFNLTFTVSTGGRTLTLEPIPAEVTLVRSYDSGGQPNLTAQRFAAKAPHAQVKVGGDKVWVKGTLEDHELVTGKAPEAAPKKVKPADDALANQRYTLTVAEQAFAPVVRALAEHMKLELKMDEDAIAKAKVDVNQRISFKVENATVDELFAAATKSTGLTAHRDGMTLEIKPEK